MGEEAATLVKGPGVLRMALHCDRGWRLRDQYSDGGGGGSTGSLMQVGPDFGGLYSPAAGKGRPSFLAEFCPAQGSGLWVSAQPKGWGQRQLILDANSVKAAGW